MTLLNHLRAMLTIALDSKKSAEISKPPWEMASPGGCSFAVYGCSVIVVASAGKDFQHAIANTVNKPIVVVDSPAPKSTKFAFQRFRLSNALKVVSFNIFQKSIDAFECFLSCICQ